VLNHATLGPTSVRCRRGNSNREQPEAARQRHIDRRPRAATPSGSTCSAVRRSVSRAHGSRGRAQAGRGRRPRAARDRAVVRVSCPAVDHSALHCGAWHNSRFCEPSYGSSSPVSPRPPTSSGSPARPPVTPSGARWEPARLNTPCSAHAHVGSGVAVMVGVVGWGGVASGRRVKDPGVLVDDPDFARQVFERDFNADGSESDVFQRLWAETQRKTLRWD
jgi:hypothetical protein